jgi:peptide/nickel transport system substrate-binding protein
MLFTRRGAIAAGLIAALPGRARAARQPGQLIFGLSTYPPNLQPWSNTGGAAATIKLLMFRGLLSYDAEGRLRPELAESWTRLPGNGWEFKLRDTVFQNGAKVTPVDVAWTIQQVAAEKSTAYLRKEFQGVARIEAPDAATVRIFMKEPTATLPGWLAGPHMPIIAGGTAESPVGAGPFRLTGQERGVSLDLTAYDRFHRPGRPKLKSIHVQVYADETERVAALAAGDVDLIEFVPWQAFQSIEANPKLKLDATVGPFMNLLFNGRSGPFRDVRLRQAVAYAIRRQEIVDAVFFGRGTVFGSLPIAPGSPWHDAARMHHWHYDPAKAKALMAEAGVADGFDCTLLATAQYGMHKGTAEIVQHNLAELGIRVKLSLPDWPQRVALGNRGQYEFAVFGTTADNNDPDGLSPLIDGALAPSYARSFGMDTSELSALLAAGRAEFDDARRHQIYHDVETKFLETAPMVTLAWRAQAFAMAREVNGFRNINGALTTYSGITLEDAIIG